MTRKIQATHWYIGRDGGKGYTADPRQARPDEVLKKGTHDCCVLECAEYHAYNSDEYTAWLLSQRNTV